MGGAVSSMAEGMGMAISSAKPIPMHKLKMHMTFFWGSHVDILFSNWPGDQGITVYLLALLLVFIAAFLVELLSFFPRIRSSRRVSTGLLLTGLSAIRTGLSYLVMLAVMSFNVGVLLTAVVGHAVGFFVFGMGLFIGSGGDERDGVQPISGHQAIGNKC